MDEFAQSRGDIDLFDDEIVPLDPSQIDPVVQQVQHISLESAPKGPSSTHHAYAYGQQNSRGRGRGGRSRGNNELLASRYAPQQSVPPQSQPPPKRDIDQQPSLDRVEQSHTPSSAVADESHSVTAQPSTEGITESDAHVTGPIEQPTTPAASRTAAVRGDRTATGGVKKPKLTEDELTAKLTAAKQRSQNLSAAHARAQADAASFEERERIAEAKRAKDAVNRKAMEGEREKNRARKIAVMGGREWDAEKNEEDFRIQGRGRGRGRGGFVRRVNGAVMDDRRATQQDGLKQYEWNEDRGRGRGRGGRARGRGPGRGGDRGGIRRGDGRATGTSRQLDFVVEAEFPSLPVTSKVTDDSKKVERPTQSRKTSEMLSPSTGGGSWADQVESSEAAKTG